MKKNYFIILIAISILLSANCAFAQESFTKQIIIVNGGDFGNPDDFVTVTSYDPQTGVDTEFATIYTQSVQDVIIHENFAYVAAQDSIVKLNIDTYEKVAAVAAQGINKLSISGETLIASFWYPVTENYVRFYQSDDLSFIKNIEGISGEAAGIFVMDDVALIAIPGPYGTTVGKIASIDLQEGTLMTEDDYGEFFTDIGYFAYWNNEITAFMKTAWGGTETKTAKFDMAGQVLEEFTHNGAVLANKTGQSYNNFYAEINNGIGQFDLETGELVNEAVVEPQLMTIAASVLDTNNSLIYITTTDFFSSGDGFIYKLNGELSGSFAAGISAQAIAVDYRINTIIDNQDINNKISAYPNPATTYINFNYPINQDDSEFLITDISGKLVYQGNAKTQIDISHLNAGLYFVLIKTSNSIFNGRFIKK